MVAFIIGFIYISLENLQFNHKRLNSHLLNRILAVFNINIKIELFLMWRIQCIYTFVIDDCIRFDQPTQLIFRLIIDTTMFYQKDQIVTQVI